MDSATIGAVSQLSRFLASEKLFCFLTRILLALHQKSHLPDPPQDRNLQNEMSFKFLLPDESRRNVSLSLSSISSVRLIGSTCGNDKRPHCWLAFKMTFSQCVYFQGDFYF